MWAILRDMALPTVPKKSFVESLPSAAPAEVVKRKKATKLEPWMVPAISKAISKGHTISSASDLIGVSARTVQRWLAEAEQEGCQDDLLLEFAQAATAARADIIGQLSEVLMVHALTDGKIALELMKVHNADFNIAKKVEAKIELEAPKKDFSKMTTEEIRLYRQLETKLLGE